MSMLASALLALIGGIGFCVGVFRAARDVTTPTFGPSDAFLGLAFMVIGVLGVWFAK